MDNKSNVTEEKHHKLVAKLKAEKFHGVLETHFIAGNIVRVKKQEVLLEKDLDRLMPE